MSGSVETPASDAVLLWQPSRERVAAANLTAFISQAEAVSGRKLADYEALWRWSVEDPGAFWRLMWSYGGVIGDGPGEPAIENPGAMPGARFFPAARLNFAENLLRRNDASDALVFWGEDKVRRRLSWAELNQAVSRLQQALRAEGVKTGTFRRGINPVHLYISIAGLSYFFFSNSPTLSAIFRKDFSSRAAKQARRRHVVDLVMQSLRP